MLVLTRRPGQSIRIGEDVEITVVEVRGDQVRLAIAAPREVAVLRLEAAAASPDGAAGGEPHHDSRDAD
jgi:carbon storage regulator